MHSDSESYAPEKSEPGESYSPKTSDPENSYPLETSELGVSISYAGKGVELVDGVGTSSSSMYSGTLLRSCNSGARNSFFFASIRGIQLPSIKVESLKSNQSVNLSGFLSARHESMRSMILIQGLFLSERRDSLIVTSICFPANLHIF
jgi:hypothetical protein